MKIKVADSSQGFAQRYEIASQTIARSMVEKAINLSPNKKVLIMYSIPLGDNLARKIGKICKEKKSQKIIFFPRDFEKEVVMTRNSSTKNLKAYFAEMKKVSNEAEAIFLIRAIKNPKVFAKIPPKRQKLFEELSSEVSRKRIEGKVPWTLIYWPTRYEAQKENLGYESYFDLFFKACCQPWGKIKKAQEKLVVKLDQAETIEFKVNESDQNLQRRTHLKMSIKGMTFNNSTIDLNYPGSEVHSAPVLNSVEGQIFYPGEYEHDGQLIEDIFLKFQQGKVVTFKAKKKKKLLGEILSRGKGAKYLGEVALGTNPGLTKRFFNDLLNEKVSGSFHLAIGHCYKNEKDPKGRMVRLNNGNTEDKTSVHWDLSLLMHPQYGGGKVFLDGELIQENGLFLDPQLAVLNPKF